MDRNQTAESTKTAAPMSEAEAFMSADGGFFQNRPPVQQEQPAEPIAPVVATSPDQQVTQEQQFTEQVPQGQPIEQIATPDASTQPAPVTVSPEIQAELDAARQAAQVANQQLQQYNQAIVQEMQQRQLQQLEGQRQGRIDQAYAVFDQLNEANRPEDARRYIREFEDRERLQAFNQARTTEQNLQEQFRQQVEAANAPMYAQHLVESNGLPAEYVAQLAQFDGRTQDRILPVLKAQHLSFQAREAAKNNELDQRIRELEAGQRGASGVFGSGGMGGSGAPAVQQLSGDSREREVQEYLSAPFIKR